MTTQPPSRLSQLRQACLAMLAPFDEQQLRRQSHPELSPLLWHVGHVFAVEAYWLGERVFGEHAIDDARRALYFPETCAKARRGARLPTPAALRAWTRDLSRRNDARWRRAAAYAHPLLERGYLAAFVRQHYAQHLETMRLAAAQLRLADSGDPAANLVADAAAPPSSCCAGQTVEAHSARLGTAAIEAYDNEQPPLRVPLAAFAIAARPVSNAQWLAFMQAGGYQNDRYWDDAGRAWRDANNVSQPQHWRAAAGGWHITDESAAAVARRPVHGIGWFEARAFARYAGARLPREAEWEAARRLGALDACGQVWEWCDDPFWPYPGFRAFPYAGYSRPWFDGDHFTARGGSVHTEPEVRRPGFRNFYPPGHRHVHAGLRLAW